MKVQASKRDTDPGKWWDPWFRKLDKGSRLLWLYLVDICDIAGFVDDFDFETASEDTGMELTEVESCMDVLTRTYKGANKVLVRSMKGPREVLTVWIVGFIRFQQNTYELNEKNRCHLGIIRRLESHAEQYPEWKDLYRTLQGPTKVVGKVRYGKVKEEGESEGEEPTGATVHGPESDDKTGQFEKLWNLIQGSPLRGLNPRKWENLWRAWNADSDIDWAVKQAIEFAERKIEDGRGFDGGDPFPWLQLWIKKGAARKKENDNVLSDDDIERLAG